jgi:hypothetical protein
VTPQKVSFDGCQTITEREAANVLMRLGTVEGIHEILEKFDSIYDSVLETEDILAEFYIARQNPVEECAGRSYY